MIKSRELFAWTEKYRPQTITECVLPNSTRAMLQGYVDTGDLPNLILAGSPGIGKTTAAMALCRQLNYQWLFINGSEESGIDVLRTTIRDYAGALSFDGSRRMVILDEADYLNANSTQPALRALMEEFASNASFLLTCNYPNRILPALHSRCSMVPFEVPAEEIKDIRVQVYQRLVHILKAENVTFDKNVIPAVIKRWWPDVRKMINEMYKAVVDGVLTDAVLGHHQSVEFDPLWQALRAKDYRAARTWIGQYAHMDPIRLYAEVFEWVHDNVVDASLPMAIILIADYQYKHTSVLDVQIHLSSFVMDLMGNVTFK